MSRQEIDDVAAATLRRELDAARAELGRQTGELVKVRNELAHRIAAGERLKGELVGIRELAERIEASHAWRWGHRAMRLLRLLTFRRAVGDGAMPRLMARVAGAEQALALPLSPAAWTAAPPSPPLTTTGLDAGELLPPRDVRRILRTQDAIGASSIDVVVCVRDALADAHRCFSSLLERTEPPFGLIVVDDGSDAVTRTYLQQLAAINPGVELHRNEGSQHGYTIAANIGLRSSEAELVVLLNSDTVVTRGWLQAIVDAAASADDVGIVGPLSNAASHQSVPVTKTGDDWAVNALPPWANEDTVGLVLARLPGEDVVDVPFLNGFCYAIGRRVIEAVGYLDEATFASGYSEENDFSRRAAEAGFRLVVATRSYVFHAKSRSYGDADRRRLAKRNYRLFLDKYGEQRVRALVEELDESATLRAVRARAAEALAGPHAAADLLPRLAVTFVLPGISRGGSGGSHSIFQEVSAMRGLGLPARVAVARAAWPRVAEVYPEAGDVFVAYGGEEELAQLTAGDDVLVATHHASAPVVAALVAARPSLLGAYYVQDYEALFAPVSSAAAVEAQRSYAAIPGAVLFAKTAWLQRTVSERTGLPVAKVEASLDLEIFNAVGRRASGSPHVVAMVRPRTPRRAPRETLDMLGRLRARCGPELRITTFGCDTSELAPLTNDPPAEHRGILGRGGMADLLRDADVFVDCSAYQAFGRTGLEAMACGAVPVLPAAGGVAEFAVDGVNALTVDTSDVDAIVECTRGLLGDPRRLAALRERGIADARRFTPERAALSEYTLFCRSAQAAPAGHAGR